MGSLQVVCTPFCHYFACMMEHYSFERDCCFDRKIQMYGHDILTKLMKYSGHHKPPET